MAFVRTARGLTPQIAKDAFVAETAQIIGDVFVGPQASIWYQTVLRGDVSPIVIGERSNVQDGTIIHGSFGRSETVLNEDVTVGHGVLLHGCRLERGCLIGMGSIVMDLAVVGEFSLVGAGSLVVEHQKIPPGVLALGRPAKVIRELNLEELEHLRQSPKNYLHYQTWYAVENG